MNADNSNNSPESASKGDNYTAQNTISGNGIEDQPAKLDYLGFKPYCEAVFSFLVNPATEPPFTLSIEGEWGSGKSSFMLQLENALNDHKYKTVKFNAWRHDKIETMWAAFALHFIKELSEKLYWHERIFARIKIGYMRFNFRKGWWPCLKAIILLGFYVFLIFQLYPIASVKPLTDFITEKGELDKNLFGLLGTTGIILSGFFLLKKISEIIGSPLEIDLKKFIVTPNYEGNSAFIEDFHRDFEAIVKNLARKEKKVFVFIDDLDRADVPKAAELMQGLNMMISNSPKLIFIIGMDRDKVAAGVAAKYKDLLLFLNPDQQALNTSSGIMQAKEFGYSFLEKFIQVSFNIPQPSSISIKNFIASLSKKDSEATETETIGYNPVLSIEEGNDSIELQILIERFSPFFNYNPRRIKQFVNTFRLKAHIANSTGYFANSASPGETDSLKIPQLGKFIAITLIWPHIVDELVSNPHMLSDLVTKYNERSYYQNEWLNNKPFMDLLMLNKSENSYSADYDMRRVNIIPLLETSPIANKANGITKGTNERNPNSQQSYRIENSYRPPFRASSVTGTRSVSPNPPPPSSNAPSPSPTPAP